MGTCCGVENRSMYPLIFSVSSPLCTLCTVHEWQDKSAGDFTFLLRRPSLVSHFDDCNDSKTHDKNHISGFELNAMNNEKILTRTVWPWGRNHANLFHSLHMFFLTSTEFNQLPESKMISTKCGTLLSTTFSYFSASHNSPHLLIWIFSSVYGSFFIKCQQAW